MYMYNTFYISHRFNVTYVCAQFQLVATHDVTMGTCTHVQWILPCPLIPWPGYVAKGSDQVAQTPTQLRLSRYRWAVVQCRLLPQSNGLYQLHQQYMNYNTVL